MAYGFNDDKSKVPVFPLTQGSLLPIEYGGTGEETAADALTALGAAPASDLEDYLLLAGGTMTGDLEIEKSAPSFIAKNTDIDQSGSAPDSSIASSVLNIIDLNDDKIGHIASTHFYNGNIGLALVAQRIVNNTEVFNSIRTDVKPDGSLAYAVSDAAAFRDAIGASSGIWPIAQGGSGQSGTLSGTDLGSIITVNSTNATLSSGYVAYWGKLAMVQFVWKNKNALSIPADGNLTDITVGTLASAYRPKGPIHGLSNGDEAGNATYYINGTSGVISLTAVEGTGAARTIPANSNFNAFFCFVMQ